MDASGRIAVAVDVAEMRLTAEDTARIEAVDQRIVVRPYTPASEGRAEPAAAESEVVLSRSGYRFGGTTVAAPRGIDAGPRAEFALHSLFSFAKSDADAAAPMTDLRDQTLLVIGLGTTGLEVARLGAELGMRVLAVNRSGLTDSPHVETIRTPTFLGDLLPVSHAVVLALPHTDRTRGMIDSSAMHHMRSDAVLVCVGASEVLDHHALASALERGHPRGAAFDGYAAAGVPADSPLFSMPNVISVSHDAGRGPGTTHRIVQDFLRHLHRYVRGEEVQGKAVRGETPAPDHG